VSRAEGSQETDFSRFLKTRRQELGISLYELERRTGLHNSRLSRWERGIDQPDRPERLAALAKGLDVPVADLYVLTGIELIDQLPSHRLYLRSAYGPDLPSEALDAITAYADEVAARYGASGPDDGEDEHPSPT